MLGQGGHPANNVLVLFVLLVLPHIGQGLTCYKCKGSVRLLFLSRRYKSSLSFQSFLMLSQSQMLFVKNIQLFNPLPVCVLWATHVRPLGRTHGDMRLKHGVLHSGHEAAGEPQTYKNKGRNEDKGQRKRQKTKTRTVIKTHGDVGLKHRVLPLRLSGRRWALNRQDKHKDKHNDKEKGKEWEK